MKKTLLTTLALVVVVGLKAQMSFGFRTAVNFAKEVNYSNYGSSASPPIKRLHVEAYVEFPLSNRFSLQPGLAFQQTGSKMSTGSLGNEILMDGWRKIQYFGVTLNLTYYFPLNNFVQFFLAGGPYASIAISGKEKFTGTVDKVKFGVTQNSNEMKKYDAGLNLLAGFKLANGISVNGGYALGLLDIRTRDISNTYNRIFSIGVGYQI
ncbi:outer membrane beta-barrel protein [Sphingobacterium sp. 2149]|uniref:porin family protein n=1 Tax=Sphingobacterium sp. 2149 TaxID=2817763 RepID=UPI001AE9A055|nr:outer membrane beta-barrel protein [Sphingobacterium sp. 2149]MDR6737628.1 hypothetical protein [Sphingobacterium sp. 2149]